MYPKLGLGKHIIFLKVEINKYSGDFLKYYLLFVNFYFKSKDILFEMYL